MIIKILRLKLITLLLFSLPCASTKLIYTVNIAQELILSPELRQRLTQGSHTDTRHGAK